jgi:hypothetical protein
LLEYLDRVSNLKGSRGFSLAPFFSNSQGIGITTLKRKILLLVFLSACKPRVQTADKPLPPSVEVDTQYLQVLQRGAALGYYFRYTQSEGSQPAHLKPDVTTITPASVSAAVLSTDQMVTFYSQYPVQNPVCDSVCFEVARAVKMSITPGGLPLFPRDLTMLSSNDYDHNRKGKE